MDHTGVTLEVLPKFRLSMPGLFETAKLTGGEVVWEDGTY